MTREHIVMLAELRDAAKAWGEDPQADVRVAKALEALASEALRDEPAEAELVEPAPANENEHAAEQPEATPARPKTFDEL